MYEFAWTMGCKGITIYRDGSRDGVLLSGNKDEKLSFNQQDAPKRPKDLPCEIHTPTIKGEQYVVVVGMLDDKPYEVFAFKFNGSFKLKEGCLRKVKKGRYDILTLDKETYSEDITTGMRPTEETITRLLSAGLRHGANIKFLIEQLVKTDGNGFQDFSKVIGRVLKKYIKDGELVTGESCEQCGGELKYEQGCKSCTSCSWSKCN